MGATRGVPVPVAIGTFGKHHGDIWEALLPHSKVFLAGLYVNFFVHSTGAIEVDSFIAQAKKLSTIRHL